MTEPSKVYDSIERLEILEKELKRLMLQTSDEEHLAGVNARLLTEKIALTRSAIARIKRELKGKGL